MCALLRPETRLHKHEETPHNFSYHHSMRRLTKPPRVHTASRRSSRKRLQKQAKIRAKTPSRKSLLASAYVLQYEQYPYQTKPGAILGVFSTFNKVSTAAIGHGAYAFSREGLLDGSEYLSATGRIKIIPRTVHRCGAEAPLPQSKTNPDGNERDINHAARRRRRAAAHESANAIDTVFVAVHRYPTGVLCVGLFTNIKKAWGACLRHRADTAIAHVLRQGSKWIDENNMPHAKCRIAGFGWLEWFVEAFSIDDMSAVSLPGR